MPKKCESRSVDGIPYVPRVPGYLKIHIIIYSAFEIAPSQTTG